MGMGERIVARVDRWVPGIRGWELLVLGLAIAGGYLARFVHIWAMGNIPLAGDEVEYNIQGSFAAEGKWFWSTTPWLEPGTNEPGDPHPTAWKAPGYPLFVGVMYSIFGQVPTFVMIIQTLFLTPLVLMLVWLIARRLFGARVAGLTVLVTAAYPLAWLGQVRLFSESIAIPFFLAVYLLILDRRPTWRVVAMVGVCMGLIALQRPSWLFLLAPIGLAWWFAIGFRQAAVRTAVVVGVTVVMVAPWTIRNAMTETVGGFVPVSIQDAAAYGVFNDDAANDPDFPWAWRPHTTRDADLSDRRLTPTESDFRQKASRRAREYIADNPTSVVKAFWWNGVRRLWSLEGPTVIVEQARTFQNRNRSFMRLGIAMYWAMIPFALVGLWLTRRRYQIVVPFLAGALGLSIVHTVGGYARYREPFEPFIVMFAVVAVVAMWDWWRRRRGRPADPKTVEPEAPAPG